MVAKVELLKKLQKYNSPPARYTLIPSPINWEDNFKESDFYETLAETVEKRIPLNLYIHIPFCENLCTFCGCNITITQDHSIEENYLQKLIDEFKNYTSRVPGIRLQRIFLGGGTPNFLKKKNFLSFLEKIYSEAKLTQNFELVIEADPRNLAPDTFRNLKSMGLKRLSIGVQDFNSRITLNVNRPQSISEIQAVYEMAKKENIKIFYDLIYGLPLQNILAMQLNLERLSEVPPDGLAIYPLAKVPWLEKVQKHYGDFHFPDEEQKNQFLAELSTGLNTRDYKNLGFGHFLHEKDSLFEEFLNKNLARNQMGVFTKASDDYLGLGVSSISKIGNCYKQNHKVLGNYMESSSYQKLRVHKQSDLESLFEQQLKNLFQTGETEINSYLYMISTQTREKIKNNLESLEKDRIIQFKQENLALGEYGREFMKTLFFAIDYRYSNSLY